MILASIFNDKGKKTYCVVIDSKYYPIDSLNEKFTKSWHNTIFKIIKNGDVEKLQSWIEDKKESILDIKDIEVSEPASFLTIDKTSRTSSRPSIQSARSITWHPKSLRAPPRDAEDLDSFVSPRKSDE